MKYPDSFPDAFQNGVEDLARMNWNHAEAIEGMQRVLDAPELIEFWPRMERQIEKRHLTGALIGPVDSWKQGFIKGVFLQLFAPKIGDEEKYRDRKERRSKDIPNAAIELARLLKKDPDLLIGFSYFLDRESPNLWHRVHAERLHATCANTMQSLADDLRLLEQYAKDNPIDRHPYEPVNNVKHARNQKALALVHIILVHCMDRIGTKAWNEIELLIGISENLPNRKASGIRQALSKDPRISEWEEQVTIGRGIQ